MRLVEAEALGDLVGDALDVDAEPAAPRAAETAQLPYPRPKSRSCSTTGRARLAGMAKPMPIEPPDGE
jgi:hypothetical protein